MTKQVYINEIENLTKKLYSYYEKKYISNGKGDFNGFFRAKKPVDDIWGKNLDGRLYIHSRAKKSQLEELYADLVNYISDKHINL